MRGKISLQTERQSAVKFNFPVNG